MRIAVVGATGQIGRPLVEELGKRGHEVRALSRKSAEFPVDLATGAGLEAALDGCAAVVNATNDPGGKPGPARALLVDGQQRLIEAAEKAGVKNHVCLSIVGIEQVPMGYYEVKVEQEQALRGSGTAATIVRATQFHSLLAYMFESAARFRVIPGGSARLQPVDPRQVAEVVAGIAEGPPQEETITVAGPEVLELGTLARTWREVTGRRGLIIRAPLPPKLGKPLRGGALTDAAPDHRGTVGFGEWLVNRART